MTDVISALSASLIGAVLIGSADFLGGLAARSLVVSVVACLGQSIGLVGVLTLIALFCVPFSWQAFSSGLGAGVCGSIAVLCLYRAMAIGRLSIVAPLSALVSALVPVVVSLLSGHSLNGMTSCAVLLAFFAIYFLTVPNRATEQLQEAKATSGFTLALIGGLATGGFYVFLGNSGVNGNIWTICGERSVIVLVTGIAVLSRKKLTVNKHAIRLTILGGICDFGGNLLYVFSAARIPLHVVALITSLYPVTTSVLGWLVLKEPLNKRLWVGLSLAIVSISIFAYNA